MYKNQGASAIEKSQRMYISHYSMHTEMRKLYAKKRCKKTLFELCTAEIMITA